MNILESGQEELSRRFADQHDDRFDGVGYHAGPDGQILLDGALAHIECERFADLPRRRPHDHRRPGHRRRHPGRPPAALLPRRLRRALVIAVDPLALEPGRRRAARRSGRRPGHGRRVAPEHRPRQPLVRRRGGGAPRARPRARAACPPAPTLTLPTSAPAWATCRAPPCAGPARARLRLVPVGLERSPVAARLAHARRDALRGRLRRRAAVPREVGGRRAGEPGGASPGRRLGGAAVPDLRPAGPPGRDRRRPPARPARAGSRSGSARALLRLRPRHGGGRHDLAPPRATPPAELARPAGGAPASAARVERRPGYRLVATWRPRGAADADGGPDPDARAGGPGARRGGRTWSAGRSCCRTTAGCACSSGGATAGWWRWRPGGRSVRSTIPPGGSRRCGWTAPRRRCTTATCAASRPAWTWCGGSSRRTAGPTSRSCTTGPGRAGPSSAARAATWVIGPVFIHGIASRTLAGIRRAVEAGAA